MQTIKPNNEMVNLTDFDNLLEIVKRKIVRDEKGNWSKGSETYLSAFSDEIEEVKQELSSGRKCHLEDELGDILWVYLCFVHNLEVEGKVSMSKVFERSYRKYQARVDGIIDGGCWEEIKAKQKAELESEELMRKSKITS
jgi:NTP pyrophosphatase (non-canonical NTP hydrolase)